MEKGKIYEVTDPTGKPHKIKTLADTTVPRTLMDDKNVVWAHVEDVETGVKFWIPALWIPREPSS